MQEAVIICVQQNPHIRNSHYAGVQAALNPANMEGQDLKWEEYV
jgi:hypothetical protein